MKMTSNNGLVSVIVPVYNSEPYLETCINSILMQSYQNLEVILVNDGSTDNSGKICENYKLKDTRVRVLHKENGGVGSSRNAALPLATGEFLLFVDHDDWLDENHIERLHQKLIESDSDIAVANFTEFYMEKQSYGIHVGEYYEKTMTPQEWFSYQYEGRNCFSQCFTVPWAKLYKRSLFDHIVYPENEKVEDDYTTYKTYLLSKKIIYLNESLYVHRKHPESVTKRVNVVHVLPIKSIEERMALLLLKGWDISEELRAYKWRMQLHQKAYLEAGMMAEYKEVTLKLNVFKGTN